MKVSGNNSRFESLSPSLYPSPQGRDNLVLRDFLFADDCFCLNGRGHACTELVEVARAYNSIVLWVCYLAVTNLKDSIVTVQRFCNRTRPA